MAGAAVTYSYISVTLTHVILRLRVAREIIGFLSVTDTYIQTISETRRRISKDKAILKLITPFFRCPIPYVASIVPDLYPRVNLIISKSRAQV